jgi:protein tyrosine phosphatase (PTP) superfamily phosphohydrolase (DUF442 family)
MIIPKCQLGTFALAIVLCLPAFSASPPVAGIPNFHQVNENVLRGGQPSPEAWPGLASLGVKTVIDLRRPDEHSTADESKAVQAAGMKYINIPMKGVVAPDEANVARILALLHSEGKVFIHCKRGADRTGAVIAAYRMEHQCWESKKALSEAKSLGMSWTQFGLKSYVKSFKPNNLSAGRPSPGCNCSPTQADASPEF